MVKRRTKKRGGGDEVAKKFPSTKKEFLFSLENDIDLEKEVNSALKKAKNLKIKIKMPNNFDEMLENIKKNKNMDKILKKIGEIYSKIIKQRKRRVQKKKIRGGGDGDDDDDEGEGEEKNGGDDDDDDDDDDDEGDIDYENLDIGGKDSKDCYWKTFRKLALVVGAGAGASALIYVFMGLPSMPTTISAASLAAMRSSITAVGETAREAGIDSPPEVAGVGGIAAILAYLAAAQGFFKPIIDRISSVLGGLRDGTLLFATYWIVNDYCRCMRKKQRSLEPEGREDYGNKCDEKKNFINEVYHTYGIIADFLPGFSPMPKEFRQRKIPNIIRILQQRFGTVAHPPLDPEGDHVLGGVEVNNRGVAINRLVTQGQGPLATIPTEDQIQAQMERERRAQAAEGRERERRAQAAARGMELRRRRNPNPPQMLRQRSGNPQGAQQPQGFPEQKRGDSLQSSSDDPRLERPALVRAKSQKIAGGRRRKTKRRRKVKKTKKRKMKKRKRKTNKKRRRTKRK